MRRRKGLPGSSGRGLRPGLALALHLGLAVTLWGVLPLGLTACADGSGEGDRAGTLDSKERPDPASLPNVLLVTLDTTRADRLGCYGYEFDTSPRIDAIARGGVVFDMTIAQASVTPVSHASILSGRNPYRNGLRTLHGNIGFRMRDDVPSLVEYLRDDLGFATAAFISALPCGKRFELDRGFETFDDPFTAGEVGGGSISDEGVVNTGNSQRTAAATNARVFEWLEDAPSDPLFVWAHYFDPHDTRLLPEDESDRSFFPPRDVAPGLGRRAADRSRMYDNEVRYMDRHVGELVDRMSELARPLLLCIVGDHGEGLGDHDWWSHGILYQEQIRVPFVLSGPGVPLGRRVDSMVRTVDIAPTLLSLIGADPGALGDVDGIDLVPTFRGGASDLGLEAYAESATNSMTYRDPTDGSRDTKEDALYVLVRDGFRYIHHIAPDGSPGAHELYDLRSDPGELRNVLSEHPDRVRAMAALDAFFDPATATRGRAITPEQRARLQALGYDGEAAPSDDDGSAPGGAGGRRDE